MDYFVSMSSMSLFCTASVSNTGTNFMTNTIHLVLSENVDLPVDLLVFVVPLVLLISEPNHLVSRVLALSELIDASKIGFINTALIQKNEKDNVVSQTGQSMHEGHFDNECEQIVDESVHGLIGHGAPVEVRNGFEFIVDEKLRSHHNETEHVNEANQGSQNPGIPALVLDIKQGINAVARDQGHGDIEQMSGSDLIVFLGLGVTVTVGLREDKFTAMEGYVEGFADLPKLNEETDAVGHEHHGTGIVIEQIEKNDNLEEGIEHHTPETETLHAVAIFEKGDVVFEGENVENGV